MEITNSVFRVEASVRSRTVPEDKIAHALSILGAIDAREVWARVSGQPLHMYNQQQERHFDNCDMQLGVDSAVGRIWWGRIPLLGHSDIPDKYLSDEGYPFMQCVTQDGTELVMGMRTVLGFEIELLED